MTTWQTLDGRRYVFEELSQQHKNIIFVNQDPTEVPTLKKPLTNTLKLHDIATCLAAANETNVYHLITVHLLCSCIDCCSLRMASDGGSPECTYQDCSIVKVECITATYKLVVAA